MSYRDQETHETYQAWSARIVADVRELERAAQYGELASYSVKPLWDEVRPGLTRCEQCGHFVLASGRCIACEVETVRA